MTVLPVNSDFPSPSLASSANGSRQAYELKFLLAETVAQQVMHWAATRLQPDPHGHSELNGAYQTTTLYFDTPQLDVYHRSPGYRSRKHRVRRYGLMSWVSLECKTKRSDKVWKERSALSESELEQLANPMSLENWPGHWFHRRLIDRNLKPACIISYLRTAMVGANAESPMRLTIDNAITGLLTNDWLLSPFQGGVPLLAGSVVMELKFLDALPLMFKQLLAEFRLSPSIVSKYRACREAWGVSTNGTTSASSVVKSVQSA